MFISLTRFGAPAGTLFWDGTVVVAVVVVLVDWLFRVQVLVAPLLLLLSMKIFLFRELGIVVAVVGWLLFVATLAVVFVYEF